MNKKEWGRLLDLYSIEDGNSYNTGSRLTMKPLAGPMPRAAKSKAAPKRRKKRSVPAA
jgi:hypothetical protein